MSTPTRQGAKFFAALRSSGVERSPDRWFAGVCGGIAARLGVDPLLVRGVLVALTVVGGLGLAFYGACWLLLPDGREEGAGRIEAEAVLRGELSGAAWLSAALVVADLVLPRALLGVLNGGLSGPGAGFLITGLVALLGWWLLRDFTLPPCARREPVAAPEPEPGPGPEAVTRPVSLVKDVPAASPVEDPGPQAGFGSPTERRAAARELAREKGRTAAEAAARRAAERARQKAAQRPGSPLLTTATLGLALLAAGAVVAAGLLTTLDARVLTLALAAAVVVAGLGAVVAGLRGRRTALIGLAWPAAFAAVATALLPPSTNWTWEVDRTWRPTTQDGLSSAVGLLTVDPAGLDAGPASATIAAGRLAVEVPRDATVLLDASALAGTVRWRPAEDVVEVGAPRGTEPSQDGGDEVAGGLDVRRVLAIGPDAAALAAAVQVRGDDPDDWTVPSGTPRLRAASWTGEVRVGAPGSTTLEGE
ncbi:PspC domain-containing protein [Kineococcus sp. SYSU DK001]|uniref:PspC domain-containing protein n=1 Tax=Kineococcus sp. SYSU DK001 TaxID=3383122 RepID=UPI003D7E6E3C